MDTLGQRISSLRKQRSLTQDALAQIMDVTPQAVSKWENGQTCPDISLLSKLAETLGVTVDELLNGKKETLPAVSLLPEEKRKDISDMVLRISVLSAQGDKVRVNLPIALIQAAIEMGMEMPELSGNAALKNIDLAKIMELVKRGLVGNLVEVESADGDTVNIFVE